MDIETYSERNEPIFQMEPELAAKLKEHKNKAAHICGQHMHRPVKVHTVDGAMHEGVIVHIDERHLYLHLHPASYRDAVRPVFPPYGPFGPVPYGPFPYNPYASAIIPLTLFNLLTIALLA